MPDAPASGAVLLQRMWPASPALPVGGFSYSEALEAAVDDDRVTGEASAAGWLANQTALAPARADLPVLAHQRHLHQGRPAPADRGLRAGARTHHGRRVRWRQPGRYLQPRAERPDDLRDRRRGRPAPGWRRSSRSSSGAACWWADPGSPAVGDRPVRL